MQAWTFTTRGPPAQVLKLRDDLPQPQLSELKPDEVLIKVSHGSLFWPQASLMSILPHRDDSPWIPGYEFSGVVVASGRGPSDTRNLEDQEVFGMISPKAYMKYNGVLAEYIIAPKESIVLKPKNATFAEAAGLGGGGCTVIGIAEKAGLLKVDSTAEGYRLTGLAEGRKILITGGSTGTGLLMLQLAKSLVGEKGTVVTTCSPRNMETVSSLEPDEIIDYTQHPHLHEYLAKKYSSTPFDTIIDFTGSDPLLHQRCAAYLNTDGSFVFAGNMSQTHHLPSPGVLGAILWALSTISMVLGWQLKSLWPVMLGGVPRRAFFHSGEPNARNLDLLSQLMESGKIKGIVDSVWEMKDVVKAWKYLEKGKICGKVIINVGG